MIQTVHEKREQLIFLAVITVLALVAVIGGLRYGLEFEERVGPGLMPFAAGVLMLVTVAVQVVRRFRMPVAESSPTEPVAQTPPTEPEAEALTGAPAEGRPDPRLVAAIFLMIVLAVAATYLVGMLISVSLLVGALFLLNDRKKPVAALIATIAAALFGWIVFVTLLNVPLPTGLLGLI